MSDRLSDERLIDADHNIAVLNHLTWVKPAEVRSLIAEVQDSRPRLAAIRALPDVLPPKDVHPWTELGSWSRGYAAAMRQVKAVLDGES